MLLKHPRNKAAVNHFFIPIFLNFRSKLQLFCELSLPKSVFIIIFAWRNVGAIHAPRRTFL